MSPGPDAVGVPLNAEVKVMRYPRMGGALELRQEGSAEPIAVTITMVNDTGPADGVTWTQPQGGSLVERLIRLRPAQLLQPNTRYELWTIDEARRARLSTFATGSTLDTSSPTLGPSFEVRRLDGRGGCGGIHAAVLKPLAVLDDATPDNELVFVATARAPAPGPRRGAFFKSLPHLGDGYAFPNFRLTEDEELEVDVFAIDRAGNRSQVQRVVLDVGFFEQAEVSERLRFLGAVLLLTPFGWVPAIGFVILSAWWWRRKRGPTPPTPPPGAS